MHRISKLALALAVTAVTLILTSSDARAETFGYLDSSQYQTVFERKMAQDWYPVFVKGYEEDGEARFNVIYNHNVNGRAVYARHNIRDAEFKSTEVWAAGNGYTMTGHSKYVVGGVRYHAAIWLK